MLLSFVERLLGLRKSAPIAAKRDEEEKDLPSVLGNCNLDLEDEGYSSDDSIGKEILFWAKDRPPTPHFSVTMEKIQKSSEGLDYVPEPPKSLKRQITRKHSSE